MHSSNYDCSLDPGVRKFQTIYSEKEVKKITTNYEILSKLKNKISELEKLRTGKIINKYNYHKKLNKVWTRQNDLIKDSQYKLSNYLVKNYSTIYIPKFESQKLIGKNKSCNFYILNLQHYKFKEHLRNKCLEFNCTFKECTEEYTSKTCTKCGTLNDVGSLEIYKCSNCNLVIDRDINGARNIYIKCKAI